jgi:hypothetical protein
MNVQFFHKRKYTGGSTYCVFCSPSSEFIYVMQATGGTTVAMEEIPNWLLSQLNIGDTFEKKIGFAYCSDEDNYNKKTGASLAKERMKLKKLTVKIKFDSQIHSGQLCIVLVDEKKNEYTIVSNEKSQKAWFVNYEE